MKKIKLYYRIFGYSSMVLDDQGNTLVRTWFTGWLRIPDPYTWPVLRRYA